MRTNHLRRCATRALGILLLSARVAAAHIFPDKCDPPVGSTIKPSPPAVTIIFTDPINVPQSALMVFDAGGAEVDKADVHADAKDDKTIAVSIPVLKPGVYTVKWAATSVHDGHKTHGDYRFTVQP